jgi:hypothetical protein
VYCNEEIEKIIKKCFLLYKVENNKQEWFILENPDILIKAVKDICDIVDQHMPRKDRIENENNKENSVEENEVDEDSVEENEIDEDSVEENKNDNIIENTQ